MTHELKGSDWDNINLDGLHKLMGTTLKTMKQNSTIVYNTKLLPTETPCQVYERIECGMERGRIGTPENFNLSWEHLLTILTIASLPDKFQEEILLRYETQKLITNNW